MPKTAQKDASVATVKKQGAVMKHIKKYWQWYAMMFIPIVYYIVFRYIPMFGNIIAFRRYRAGSSIFGDEWSGLKYFNQFMKDQNFWRAFKNTLLLNFKYLIISFPLTLIFALLLNEVKNVHFKKIVQTISYLPHFISMVIVAGMVREILSTIRRGSDGDAEPVGHPHDRYRQRLDLQVCHESGRHQQRLGYLRC